MIDSTDFMNGKNHEIYNMADFLEKNPSSKSYSQDIFSKAGKYIQAVKEIQQEYGINPLLTNEIHAGATIHFFKSDPSYTIKAFKEFDQYIRNLPSTNANATEGASAGLLQVPKGNTLYVTPDTSSGYLSTEHSEAAFLPQDREGLISQTRSIVLVSSVPEIQPEVATTGENCPCCNYCSIM